MNKSKSIILFVLLILSFNQSNASTVSILDKKPKDNGLSKQLDNIRRRDLVNFGNIIENEVLVGYYMFRKMDNTGGGKALFQLEILDENLKSKKTIKFEKKKNQLLVEMCYNGKVFLIIMTNKKGIDMITYSKDGKKVSEKNIKKLNKYERARMSSSLQSEETNLSTIYPMGENGFYRQSYVKNKKLGFTVEAFSNDLKTLWTYTSSKTSKEVEAVDILYASENYLALLHAHKKNLMTKEINNDFLFLDGKDGKKMFSLPMKEISTLSIQGCYVNEAKNEIILNGEYFAKGSKIYNSKSEGLYLMKLNLEGEELKMEKLSWKKDLTKLLVTDADKGSSKENMRFFVHKVINDSNGKTYIIAEQYKRIISAKAVGMNIANAALGGGGSDLSNISIKIYNLVYLVLDADFKVQEMDIVKKKFSEFYLPKGAEFYSPTMIAQYIKATNNFDYQFTSLNKDKSGFITFYIDLNRKSEDKKKNDAVIGTISLSNGAIETKRIPFNTEFNTVIFRNAKQGYILIGEYWRKKKQLMLRLEPVI